MTAAAEHSARSLARWAAAGLAIHLALAGGFLVAFDGNPQWFVHFGTEHPGIQWARSILGRDLLTPHQDGHDGQAYWALARDPLLVHGRDVLARNLDRPVYRAQRIAYPAIAAAWRLGGETALLWGLLITNLLVVFAGGWLAGLLAHRLGAPLRASLGFALCPGIVVATLFDIADGLALVALLAVILAIQQQRLGWAIAAGVLGVLAKEPTLLGLVGIAALAPAIDRRTRLAIVLVPTAAMAGWGLYARWRLGWLPTGVDEFVLPFAGYVEAWRLGWSQLGNWADAAFAFALIPIAIVGTRWWIARRTLLLSAAVPFLWLVPFLSGSVLDLTLNSLRAITPAVTLLILDGYAAAAARSRT